MILATLCLAMAIHFEGMSEPAVSQVAIADVVMKRSSWENKNVCKEVYRPWQFTAMMHKPKVPSDRNANWQHSLEVAREVISCGARCDVTAGADHYYMTGTHQKRNFKLVMGSPYWAAKCAITATYGHHTYCRESKTTLLDHAYVASVPINLTILRTVYAQTHVSPDRLRIVSSDGLDVFPHSFVMPVPGVPVAMLSFVPVLGPVRRYSPQLLIRLGLG